MKRHSIFILSLLLGMSSFLAQDVIQFSGIVVTGDSLNPVPYTSIMVKDSKHGTTSDYFGFFSFVAQETDTVEFSAVGYRKSRFIIPDSIDQKRYSLIQVLSPDTIQLREVTIYPWPSKEAFKEAFLEATPADDDYSRAANNLGPSRMLVMMETMDTDGFANYKLSTQEYNNRLYYAGQAPPINLMNPMAWASFIDALRKGSLKDKKKR